MSDNTKQPWPEADEFWPNTPSPYEGPQQGGRVDLPQREEPRQVTEAE
jgi:hypothetical protein